MANPTGINQYTKGGAFGKGSTQGTKRVSAGMFGGVVTGKTPTRHYVKATTGGRTVKSQMKSVMRAPPSTMTNKAKATLAHVRKATQARYK